MEDHDEPQLVVVRAIGVGTAENGAYGLFVEAKARGIDGEAAVDFLAEALAREPDEGVHVLLERIVYAVDNDRPVEPREPDDAIARLTVSRAEDRWRVNFDVELGAQAFRMSIGGPGPGRRIASVVRDTFSALSRCSADELGRALTSGEEITAGELRLDVARLQGA